MSSSNNSNKTHASIVMTHHRFVPTAFKMMAPRENRVGGRSITVISTQTGRSLHLETPTMRTFGISDYTNEEGESDGKFTISLLLDDSEDEEVRMFKEKVQQFEDAVLDYAVANSELWFGEVMSKDMAQYTMFRTMKYPKIKNTKKPDMTRSPTMKAKVANYQGRWEAEIYDSTGKLMFPNENKDETPIDYVTKNSFVACVLQCTGAWIGGKGWGLSYKFIQCVLKKNDFERASTSGRCLISLGPTSPEDEPSVPAVGAAAAAPAKKSVYVNDSDDEDTGDKKAAAVASVAVAVKAVAVAVAVEEPGVEDEDDTAVDPATTTEMQTDDEPVLPAVVDAAPVLAVPVLKRNPATAPSTPVADPPQPDVAVVVAAAAALPVAPVVIKKKVIKRALSCEDDESAAVPVVPASAPIAETAVAGAGAGEDAVAAPKKKLVKKK